MQQRISTFFQYGQMMFIVWAFFSFCSCKRKETLPPKKLPMTTSFVRANFHAHTTKDDIHDDGQDTPLQLHTLLKQRGVQFSLHSVHSIFNLSASAKEQFQRQKEKELNFHIQGITVSLGEELTVQKGPHYRKKHEILGTSFPGNLNHVTLLGIHSFVPNEVSLSEACQKAHDQEGVCIINHPGPGPMMWEEGLWESPQHRHFVDAIEVYNGMAMAGFGKHFEARYLEATAFSGLGMKVAATASADTHGPRSLENSRHRLGKLEAWAERMGQIPPMPKRPRAELDAWTFVASQSAEEKEIVKALQERKTIAAYGMGDLTLEYPNLGKVISTNKVSLQIQLSKPVDKIQLYKEGTLLQTFEHTDQAFFEETIKTKAAYVFIATLGSSRLTTSAVWYTP